MPADIHRTPLAVSFGDVSDHSSTFGNSSPIPSVTPLVPLGATKLLASTRRGVIFSPSHETKLFNSADSIIASKDASVRSYAIASTSSPSAPRPPPSPLSSSPAFVRPILKQKLHEIRLARSVEEGTMNNKEPARLLVTGVRPKLVQRDSFQLAQLRQAAGAENLKGKGRMEDDAPGSDDSISSGDSNELDPENAERNGEEEEEEEEEVESLHITSLVSVILNGADDLLTLEEAYITLTSHLRDAIPMGSTPITTEIREAVQPIRDESPALVRAMQRDLSRLMGKIPVSEQLVSLSGPESSPFRGLAPMREMVTPAPRDRMTPSPTPAPLDGPSRQGYTEAEVRYRREASGVGAALLRFLGFTFHCPHVHSCFSDADLQTLLDQVMIIPRTPRLPTPNPKRTYYLSIALLSMAKVNPAIIQPVKEKIVRAVEGTVSDSLYIGIPSKENQVKKEAYNAIINLVSTYPSIFLASYSDFLPCCFRGMTSALPVIRHKASAAAATFAVAKMNLLADAQDEALTKDATAVEAWSETKSMVARLEQFVVTFFKSPLRTQGRLSYTTTGGKKLEWHPLDNMFKNVVGTLEEVTWACSTWATIVTLIGSAYNASSLTLEMDHIMDRSLQASTNAFRPALAAAAWQHAIHAYLRAGVQSSIRHGKVICSWRPFVASKNQDSLTRLRSLFLPFDVALRHAHDAANYARILAAEPTSGEVRFKWDRQDKVKKFQWMVTCGLSAASLVYAFTGIALNHEDLPAKEVSAMSGLPSSDGAAPDLSPEDNKFRRLDETYEKVLSPTLKSLLTVNGVDALKEHGWQIFEAVTDSRDVPSAWSLERLLVAPYIHGSLFEHSSSLPAVQEAVETVLSQRILPSEIPSWGKLWMAKRLGKLLDLFKVAFNGLQGISDVSVIDWVSVEGVGSAETALLLPTSLSKIWCNLLNALAIANIPNAPPTPVFAFGLQAVTRTLVEIFERDPTTYIPLCFLNKDHKTKINLDTIRISIVTHLYSSVSEILGPVALGSVRLPVNPGSPTPDAEGIKAVFGADAEGQGTAAGTMLGHVLRSKALDALPPNVRGLYRRFIGALLDDGCAAGHSTKLLGDITNCMPWIFEDQEELQLDVWRLLASKWTNVVDLSPSSSSGSSTNHTGALLVNLLSGPFRGRDVNSVWHQNATQEDLQVWKGLLRAVVFRFRARRVGSNFGVLESLAGHLVDYLEADTNTSSSIITLSCLAAATSWISFVPTEHYHGSHYNINENYVPNDFLSLVADALCEAYPKAKVGVLQGSSQEEYAPISPAIGSVLDSLNRLFESLSPEFVKPVLEPVHKALALWMADDARVASDLGELLDKVYVTVLCKVSSALQSGHMEANSETIKSLIDILAPRLSRAQTSAVPEAFKELWQSNFTAVHSTEMADEVVGFLADVMAAVPGMITVRGLHLGESLSSEESEAKYPHASILAGTVPIEELIPAEEPQPVVEAITVVIEETVPPAVNESILPVPETIAYDADVSQSVNSQVDAATQEPAGPSNESAQAVQAQTTSSPKDSTSRRERMAKVRAAKEVKQRTRRSTRVSAVTAPVAEEQTIVPEVEVEAVTANVAILAATKPQEAPVEAAAEVPNIMDVSEVANESLTESLPESVASVADQSKDVFGPASGTKRGRGGRGRKRRSQAAETPREAKRPHIETESETKVPAEVETPKRDEGDITRIPDSAEMGSSPNLEVEEVHQNHSDSVAGDIQVEETPTDKTDEAEREERDPITANTSIELPSSDVFIESARAGTNVFVEASSPSIHDNDDEGHDGEAESMRPPSILVSTTRWLSKFLTPSRATFDFNSSSPIVERRTVSPERAGGFLPTPSEAGEFVLDEVDSKSSQQTEEDELQLLPDTNEPVGAIIRTNPAKKRGRKANRTARSLRRAVSEADVAITPSERSTRANSKKQATPCNSAGSPDASVVGEEEASSSLIEVKERAGRGVKRTRSSGGLGEKAGEKEVEAGNNEEEDELLLSPESARKRRKEEDGVIAISRKNSAEIETAVAGPGPNTVAAAAAAVVAANIVPASPIRPTSPLPRHVVTPTKPRQSAQDPSAPQLQTQSPPASPLRRAAADARAALETRILEMMEESARAKEVVENMTKESAWKVFQYAQEVLQAAGKAMARQH